MEVCNEANVPAGARADDGGHGHRAQPSARRSNVEPLRLHRSAHRSDRRSRGSPIRSRRVHARSLQRGAAPAPLPGPHARASRRLAEGAASKADRAHWRLPVSAAAAAASHRRDSRVLRLPAREDRLRQPSGRQRARVSPASRQGAPGGDSDLRARTRAGRRRYRRHRRAGTRADRQSGVRARLCDSGCRSRDGRGGDRTHGLRMPAGSDQRTPGVVEKSMRARRGRRVAPRRDDGRMAGVGCAAYATSRAARSWTRAASAAWASRGAAPSPYSRRLSNRAFEPRWSAVI